MIIFGHRAGLDPSGYRGNSALHNDENDALLGGQAQMTDEERFKVGFSPFKRCIVSEISSHGRSESLSVSVMIFQNNYD